jgi:hypothetical protein
MNHQNHNNDIYAFQGKIASLSLPEPPTDEQVVFDSNNDSDEFDENRKRNTIVKVPARFNYVIPSTTTLKLLRDANGNDSDDSMNGSGWFTNHKTIYVDNGRRRTNPPYTLHENGFELIDCDNKFVGHTVLPVPTNINFMNHDHVIDQYYPHCQQLLQQYLGPNVHVYAFDHNVRKQQKTQQSNMDNDDDDDDDITTATKSIQKPVGIVHGDYTTISGPRRLQLLSELPKINDILYHRLMDNSNDTKQKTVLDPNIVHECLLGRRRYALMNVWRNIDPKNPVASLPLACVDAQTQSVHDLRTLEIHYTDRVGENYLACHPQQEQQGVVDESTTTTPTNREHQWVYFPHMDYTEALLIKQWDSAGDIAKLSSLSSSTTTTDKNEKYISTFSLHSAFIDPTTSLFYNKNNNIPPPPRQSIEVRCVAIWDTPM